MEVALRQRLEGVAAISISESAQTTEVIFTPGDHEFSVEAFKGALKQADVEVVTMDVDACGRVERHGDERRLRAGKIEFVLQSGASAPDGASVCVAGRIQESSGRLGLAVSRVEEPGSANDS
jgi:hypothetical protein